ncbi:hypothetical protein [Stenotrophomonas sp. Iso1]|uniref:hypothetical protein n=1 Tax=Stenotrophomonas sp. Iso1 TaxID=2977283 RepID=UPI0022B7C192|nr:hypothetical protein [Stenotrophomonas sp. Iso1]
MLLMGLLGAGLVTGASHLPLLAITLLLLCGSMVQRMTRVRRRFGGWQWLAALMLLVFQPEWSGLDAAAFGRLAVGCVLAAIGQVMVVTWSIMRLSRQIQCVVDAMNDADVLALLPTSAAEDARLWLAGDDRKQVELAQVIMLSVLHAALTSVPARKGERRALYG